MITQMAGLELLSRLETLILLRNSISRIEGLAGCTSLRTLELDHNRLRDAAAMKGLAECPAIEVINLSDDTITGDQVLSIMQRVSGIRVL